MSAAAQPEEDGDDYNSADDEDYDMSADPGMSKSKKGGNIASSITTVIFSFFLFSLPITIRVLGSHPQQERESDKTAATRRCCVCTSRSANHSINLLSPLPPVIDSSPDFAAAQAEEAALKAAEDKKRKRVTGERV